MPSATDEIGTAARGYIQQNPHTLCVGVLRLMTLPQAEVGEEERSNGEPWNVLEVNGAGETWPGHAIRQCGNKHIPTKYSLSRRRTTPTQAVSPLSNREDDHPSLHPNEVGPSRLRRVLQGDVIAKPFEGLHRPLALLSLLSRLEVRVPCLLIERPLGKQVIDDHQDFVSSCQCRFLPSETPFQSPERLTSYTERKVRRSITKCWIDMFLLGNSNQWC